MRGRPLNIEGKFAWKESCIEQVIKTLSVAIVGLESSEIMQHRLEELHGSKGLFNIVIPLLQGGITDVSSTA